MDARRAGDHGLWWRYVICLPFDVCDTRPGFFTDQAARGDIPWIERHLPEAVEAASRHIAEIECRRAEPADTLGELPEFHKIGKVILGSIPGVVGESCHQQASLQLGGRGDSYRTSV